MRYLIVKTSAFGDVVHAFQALEFLHAIDPEAVVDWVVEKKVAPLVMAHPKVHRVIQIDMKKWKKSLFAKVSWSEFFAFRRELQQDRYDAVIDLQGNMKSALVTALARSHVKVGFGFRAAPESLSASVLTHRYNPPKGQNIRDDYLFLLQSHFKKNIVPSSHVEFKGAILAPKENTWLICPHSNWINKQLREETLLSFLLDAHAAYKPNFVFLSGSESEKAISTRLKDAFTNATLLHQPSFTRLQETMQRASLVISMDSLPLHLAATTDTPTYSFFGPSSSHKYAPKGSQHGSCQGACPYGRTFEKRCPILRTCKTGACLRDISSDTLFKAFQAWFVRL